MVRRFLWFGLLAAGGGLAGCASAGWGDDASLVKPTVAVMKFENRAPFPLGWKVGDGTRDILVDRLVATGRFQVIERPELDSVLRELQIQHSGATRDESRATLGRIKNVQYLVKGTITDFGHVSSGAGFFDGPGWNVFGSGARAIMGMTLYVVDVESGQIICSESLEESVRARDLEVKAAYEGMAFGGRAFYRTPLGRATAHVIDKAVRKVAASIADQPWVPKIALIDGAGNVILNGGTDRRVQEGAEFDVVEAGAAILDPDTGDVLGRQPGRTVGRVRVGTVHKRHAVASVVSGEARDFRIGQVCRPAGPLAAR